MKKLALSLLMALPVMFGMSSCDDEKSLPDVNVTVEFAEGQEVDGVVTVAQGEPIAVESITAKNNEAGKNAAVANVRYFINGVPMGFTNISPFAYNIQTSNLKVGDYTLNVEFNILAVDKSLATGVVNIPVKVTEAVEAPEGGTDVEQPAE